MFIKRELENVNPDEEQPAHLTHYTFVAAFTLRMKVANET